MGIGLTSPFNPAAPQAQSICDLLWLATLILSAILILVGVTVTWIVIRFRSRAENEPEPPQVYGHTRLELTWTLIPLGIVTLLTVLMARTMFQSHPDADRAPDIFVTGHQWWWEVRYAATGLLTANEVHVPVGRRTLVQLDSADVIHDFWVPQLGPKQDMLPMMHSHVWLEPSQAGTYDGACAEFCGNQHAWMRTRVVAQEPAVFEAWQKAEGASTPLSADAATGQALFSAMSCINCHRGPGMAEGPTVAPDLTWVGDRSTLGAGVLSNSRENLGRWLKNPQAIKPQCNMPDFQLTDAQVEALVAYLWRTSHE